MINNETNFSVMKFGAPWCAPCKMVDATLNKIKDEFESIKFDFIDVDDNPELSKDHKIKNVPTVILLRNGEEITRLVGVVKTEALRKALRDLIQEKAA